jgi:hypothetical protein
VYVKQTPGAGAPALPPTFIAALIGHGADRFVKSDIKIISDGNASQVLDAERNVASIVGIKVNNITKATSEYSLLNEGNLPLGSAKIVWSVIPAAGVSYYVTYIAYKNPAIDFEPVQINDDMDAQLAIYGIPALATSDVINGVNIKNNLSLGAYIGSAHGAKSWYATQLNSFAPLVDGVTPAFGTCTGLTGATGSTATSLSLAINGEDAKAITLAAGVTGAAAATAIQAGVRALTADNTALQAAYDQFGCTFTSDKLILTSGMVGKNSNVVASGPAAAGLKLGAGVTGDGPVFYDLTDSAGLYSATDQALKDLEKVYAYVIVPLFPVVSGGVNDTILSLIEAHVTAMRALTVQMWRIAILSAAKNGDLGTNPEAKYIAAAAALGTNALAYASPGTAKLIYGGVEYTVDGYSIAAAIGGIMTNPNYGAGEPIAGKQLVGFSEIKDRFNTTQKNLMGNAGIIMIDSEMGSPAIIMDLTTDQSSNVLSQLKFTRAADYVAKSLRLILRRLYINTNNLGTATLANIGTSVKMILQQMAWLHIINDFSDPSVKKNATDARQVDLGVNIQLVPDVSWIYVNLGVNL